MDTSLSSPLLIVPPAVEETFHQVSLVVVTEGGPTREPLEVGIHSITGTVRLSGCEHRRVGSKLRYPHVGCWYTDKRLSGNSFKREPFIGDFFWWIR